MVVILPLKAEKVQVDIPIVGLEQEEQIAEPKKLCERPLKGGLRLLKVLFQGGYIPWSGI